ncbi:putative transporter [Trachipleistophora hominis]|uniref:Putative transporter n=1 Tax=Trachipleistophora hominis TaxID=72359 RepID=L7K008_TRAHO|nr:putative transporter [Trachipleistophora hominis]
MKIEIQEPETPHSEPSFALILARELYYLLLAFVFIPPSISDKDYNVVIDFFIFPPLMVLLTLLVSVAFIDTKNTAPIHFLFGIVLMLSYLFIILLSEFYNVVSWCKNEFTDYLHVLKFTLVYLPLSFLLIGVIPQFSIIIALINALCQAVYMCRAFMRNKRSIDLSIHVAHFLFCTITSLVFVLILGKVVYPGYFTAQHVVNSFKQYV